MNKKIINLNVNGVPHTLEIEFTWSLLKVLRDMLGLTGPKHGCDGAVCGACTVLMDNKPIPSCIILAVDADGRDILTIEGLAEGARLHTIQEAFIEHHGMQCGFCTSGMIMSAKALLHEKPKPTEEEVKEALKGNLCRCGNYPSIVKSILMAAEKRTGGEEVREGFKVVGKSLPLKEGIAKVTGRAKYSADIQLPGTLYAKILGSPHPHANIVKIDTSKAESLPGVEAVITWRDVPRIMFHQTGTGRLIYILDEHLRCIGDEVAVVAAETEEIAEEATGLIDVEYEVLTPVFDPREAAKADAPKLYSEGNVSNLGGKPLIIEWGNIEKSFREADVVIEDIFRTQMQHHAPIEPRACVTKWDKDELTVWVPTQTPHSLRENLEDVFNLPVKKVNVISYYIGGAFGGKKVERYPFLAALLAKKTGKPVKMEYTSKEEFTIGRRRYSTFTSVRMGAKKDGTFTAIDYECYYDVGAHGGVESGSCHFFGAFPYIYKFVNARFKGWDVNTNLITAQTFRAVPYPVLHFAVEQVIDQIAEKLEIDPIKIRLKNVFRSGDKYEPLGVTLSSYAIEACVDKSIEAIGWEKKWKGWNTPVKIEGSKRRGIGVAMSTGWCTGNLEQAAAIVKIRVDGTAELTTGSQDLGTGSNTSLCQIVAEELRLSIEDVDIITAETKKTPYDWGSLGSRTLYTGGLAAKGAAEHAKKKIFDLAAPVLGVESEKLELKNKKVYIRGVPDKAIPIPELITTPVESIYVPSMQEELNLYVGAAIMHIAEVDVDMDTSEVKIIKYVASLDVGKAINPLIVKNQIYGAVIQGIGCTLIEELVFDQEKQVYRNPNFTDYKILGAPDIPDIETIIVESIEPTGPFGAKGVGEFGLNPVHAVIANAIYHAIGVRIRELPITAERIFSERATNRREKT